MSQLPLTFTEFEADGSCPRSNVNAAASQYDSLTLNNSASVIDSLLGSNALSVIGNVPINASETAEGEDAMSTVDPTAVAAETSPSVFDPDNQSDGNSDARDTSSEAQLTPSMTIPSLFSDISSAGLRRRQATATSGSAGPTETTASRTSVAASASSTSRLTENYLGAVMAAANLTVGGLNSATPSASTDSGGGGGGATSTSLAMLVLYAITGLVTFLFLLVIISGAIRAARHPERYGPRTGAAGGAGGAGGGQGGAQTRASGLTRAILDTFPVVRFGNGGQDERRDEEAAPVSDGDDDAHKKAAAGSTAGHDEHIELAVLPAVAPAIPMRRSSSDGDAPRGAPTVGAAAAEVRPRAASRASTSAESFHSAATTPAAAPVRRHSSSSLDTAAAPSAGPSSVTASHPTLTSNEATAESTPATATHSSPSQAAVDATLADAADAAEADLCPICFCEFEDGDELRVLPCDNRHRFHSACIDPFLLNVSRLCPLCRLDLATVAPHVEDAEDSSPHGATSDHHDGAEGERHEEERVIRHLRGLLHRGSHSSPAGAARPTVAAARGADAEGGEAGEGVDGEGGAAGFRSRFAQYVTARRGRTRRGSSFSAPRLGATFSSWAAGPAGDGRIGAPV